MIRWLHQGWVLFRRSSSASLMTGAMAAAALCVAWTAVLIGWAVGAMLGELEGAGALTVHLQAEELDHVALWGEAFEPGDDQEANRGHGEGEGEGEGEGDKSIPGGHEEGAPGDLDAGPDPVERAHLLAARIRQMPFTARVTVVTPEEALEDLRKTLGADQDVLEGVNADWLPPSIHVHLAPDHRDDTATRRAAVRLADLDGVHSVTRSAVAGEDGRRFWSFLEVVRLAALLSTLLMFAAAAWIVAGSVTFAAQERKDEIRVLRLVGATQWYVLGPMVVQGALLGLLGTVMALGGMGVLGLALLGGVGGADGIMGLGIPIGLPPLWGLVATLMLGPVVGAGGAGLVARRQVTC